MPPVTVPDISVATTVSGVGVNTENTVTVADVSVASTISSAGVNTGNTVVVGDIVCAVAVGVPTLYLTAAGGPDKSPPTLTHIPVAEGYEVRSVDDFMLVRYDGGISKFRNDRSASQMVWKVRAKFVFTTAVEYSAAVDLFVSGVPFETDLVIATAPDQDVIFSGSACRCWPIPESIRLGTPTSVGLEVSLEFFAVEV